MNTAQDVVDHLLTAVGGGAQDGEHKAVRQAVVHAVREVVQCRDWLWHTKTGQFTSANVIAQVNSISAGSPVIQVASSDGMVVGRLVRCPPYFKEPCRIVSVQGSAVTLDRPAEQSKTESGPASMTVQTFYELPAGLRNIDTLVTDTVGTLHSYVSPQEWQRLEINTRGTGEPYYYTIMRSDVSPDRYQVRFVGVPTNGTIIHYTYRYTPRPIKYMGYEALARQGTVSAAGTTVTGTGTAFPEDAAGSVIRFGTPSSEPDPIGSLSPYLHQRVIESRGSSTSLTVDAPVTAAALTRYSISDPIDASPSMYTAILSAAEMWYARLAGKPGDAAVQMYGRDLRLAMENDTVAPLSGRPIGIPYPTPRSAGWRSSILPNVE